MGTAVDVELPEAIQRRNSLVYMLNNSLTFLVAPVFYVGVLHAAILKSFQTSDMIANLPAALNQWVMPLPVLIAWLWPSTRLLKPMLATALFAMGAAGFIVASLMAVAPADWLIPALGAHAAAIGIANGVRQMCLWELLGRGMSAERRGRTLGWTFGLSPMFAVLGSCASQVILSGNLLDLVHVRPVPPPWSYVILFGVTAPVMWLSAGLVALIRVPPDGDARSETRFRDVWLSVKQYCLNPLIMVAVVGFLLTYGGTMIMSNLSLYARETIGEAAVQSAGLQLALRFGPKSIAGFILGWLVTRFHPKAALLATTATGLAGVCWALLVPGRGYLLSFGFLGAGELFYVYYLNYIVGCSTPERIRENTAYTNLIGATVGFFPLVFGAVSDRFGLRSSFGVALAILAAAIVIVVLWLPRQPRVRTNSAS